jgi:protocatechuate 3,4-dioxygenase beta subunit
MSAISIALTDSEGKYCAVRIPPGTYDVVAECKGFARGGKRTVSVPEDAEITSVDIVLVKGGTFCGRVTTLEGEPIKAAQVRIYSVRQQQERESPAEDIWRDPRVTLTDGEGKFSIESIALGEYEAVAVHPEYLPSDRRSIRVEAEETAQAKFLLELGGEISGTVADSQTGKPVENAQIFLAASDNTLVLARGCLTDSTGKYRLTGLESKTVNLRVIARGYINETRQNVDVVQGRKIEEIDFALNRGAFVSGTVTSEDGNPIAGATVSSTDATSYAITTTDSDGKFKLEGLSGGQIAIAARASGYSLLVQRGIQPNTENLILTLRKAGTVSGRVIAEAPLPEFVVIIYAPAPQPGKPRTVVAQAISRRAQGGFTVQDVPPGRYTVEARIPGYTQTSAPEVTVTAGETTTGVEIFTEKSRPR